MDRTCDSFKVGSVCAERNRDSDACRAVMWSERGTDVALDIHFQWLSSRQCYIRLPLHQAIIPTRTQAASATYLNFILLRRRSTLHGNSLGMSRVPLGRIPSITLYKDAKTLSRRGRPVPQLTCIGKPCRLYQPEVVRCTNVGGLGTDVDWKCEADLPDSLRFGRVEVSCEGWDGPGDQYVLKGALHGSLWPTQVIDERLGM